MPLLSNVWPRRPYRWAAEVSKPCGGSPINLSGYTRTRINVDGDGMRTPELTAGGVAVLADATAGRSTKGL